MEANSVSILFTFIFVSSNDFFNFNSVIRDLILSGCSKLIFCFNIFFFFFFFYFIFCYFIFFFLLFLLIFFFFFYFIFYLDISFVVLFIINVSFMFFSFSLCLVELFFGGVQAYPYKLIQNFFL